MADRRYKAILLDVDGTLLDFEQAERQGIGEVLKYYGFEPEERLFSLYRRINQAAWAAFERGEVTKEALVCQRFADFFGEIGKQVNGTEAERLYRSVLDGSAVLIDGAEELCRYLKERYELYIVTNGTSSTQYKRLAASGLDRFFKDIFVSEDAGSQKPQKAYFDYCFKRIPGIAPERMLLVGDSLHSDILGGRQAGTGTCWFNPKGTAGERGIQADYEIRRLLQLKDIV